VGMINYMVLKEFSSEKVKKSAKRKLLLMIFDFDNVYNLGYCILAGFAFEYPNIYAILLLDIIK